MKNILLRLQFDGSNYSGFQKQTNALTIQEELESAIEKVTSKYSKVVGCSRTDSGVHALDYVCNFLTDSKIEAGRFYKVLNCILPKSIAITESYEVDVNFNSRFSVKSKMYSYVMCNSPVISPFLKNYCLKINQEIDVSKIKMAANFLIGTHDFFSFMSKNGHQKTTIRTVYECKVFLKSDFLTITDKKQKLQNVFFDPYFIKIEILANAFLYNMVRIIAGTLLEVGKGKIDPESVLHILAEKNRSVAGPTLPPHGLFLEKVYI